MISIREARSLVLAAATTPGGAGELVPVTEAAGRVLGEDVAADGDLPPFDRVMMDGFAVRAADVSAPGASLTVVGEVAAGDTGDRPLEPGQALEIMTGAPLPPGADAVVPVEWSTRDGDRVTFDRTLRPGQHVAPRAEDVAAGSVVARAGQLIGALDLSLLIAAGVGHVQVRRRPSVAVLTSGNELVPPGAPVRRGQIRESNGPALRALLAHGGADVRDLGVARDTREELTARLRRALEADVVVLTGGSSVGKYDLSAEVVEATGARCHFDRIAVKPGKPTLFYTREPGGGRGRQLIFCLPGNPVAALMTGRVLVAAGIAALGGARVPDWTPLSLPLAAEVRRNPARDLLIPMRVARDGDGPDAGSRLVFDGWHGSGDLSCMSGADGFGFVARGEGAVPAGTPADFFVVGAATP